MLIPVHSTNRYKKAFNHFCYRVLALLANNGMMPNAAVMLVGIKRQLMAIRCSGFLGRALPFVGIVAACFTASAVGAFSGNPASVDVSASAQVIRVQADSQDITAPEHTESSGGEASFVSGEEARLDQLYEQLRTAASAEKAAGVAKSIEAFWQHQAGSAANLLADRAVFFARKGEVEKAITMMDQVVLLQPSFAEGWRRRAQLYMQRSNPVRAMLDLRETLRQEPRHYQAWVALGNVLEANNDPYRALAAYRRALGLYPHLSGLSEKVESLSQTVRAYSL